MAKLSNLIAPSGVATTDDLPQVLSEAQVTDDTSTVFGTVSGQRLGQSFAGQEQQVGVGQTWQDVAGMRSQNTTYQNTTGKPIVVCVTKLATSGGFLELSSDNSTFVQVARVDNFATGTVVVPDGYYYKVTTGFARWAELR